MTALYRRVSPGLFACTIYDQGRVVDRWTHANLYWLFQWKAWCYPEAVTVDDLPVLRS